MAKRLTQVKVMVEQFLEKKFRITKATVMVEEQYEQKLLVTQAAIIVEYRTEDWRHSSVPVQMF